MCKNTRDNLIASGISHVKISDEEENLYIIRMRVH